MLARERDLDETRERLTRWMQAKARSGEDFRLSALSRPSAGLSNDTFLVDVSSRQGGVERVERLVVRGASTKGLEGPRPLFSGRTRRGHRPARSAARHLIFFRDDEVIGVLDWEMAFLGDPEADLGWWLFLDWATSEAYGIPRLEGPYTLLCPRGFVWPHCSCPSPGLLRS